MGRNHGSFHFIFFLCLIQSQSSSECVHIYAHACLYQDVCALSRSALSYSLRSPWTVAHQTPLFLGLPRKDTGAGCRFLLHGIFLTQGSNLRLWSLLHWQADSLPLSRWGSPCIKVQLILQVARLAVTSCVCIPKISTANSLPIKIWTWRETSRLKPSLYPIIAVHLTLLSQFSHLKNGVDGVDNSLPIFNPEYYKEQIKALGYVNDHTTLAFQVYCPLMRENTCLSLAGTMSGSQICSLCVPCILWNNEEQREQSCIALCWNFQRPLWENLKPTPNASTISFLCFSHVIFWLTRGLRKMKKKLKFLRCRPSLYLPTHSTTQYSSLVLTEHAGDLYITS